jgi:histidinol-phosphate phosphatase family protein
MVKRPVQAVILAGGLGTRLKAITDLRPKPLIEFYGKAFLLYIIEHLKSQGFSQVLLLLGYLPEMFQEYLGNGRKFGVDIEYSITSESDDTGRRIKLAEPLIDDQFFLMYCDNYWPFSFERLWGHYQRSGVAAQLSVYSNKDGYTRNNVQVRDRIICEYDKTRKAAGLNGVEIGFGIFPKTVLDLLGDDNSLFETKVYPPLIKEKQLAGFVTDHRYYSVGSFERLSITRDFLARRPTVILDRDGVLNKKPPKAEYVRNWNEFEWLPGAKEGLKLLRKNGYQTIIVTNQAGIARGVMTESDLRAIHLNMRRAAIASGGEIDAVYYCPHGWDEGCECRKPKPGMLFQAQREFQLDLSRTFFVGDDERDVEAGATAGCKTLLVDSNHNLADLVRSRIFQR